MIRTTFTDRARGTTEQLRETHARLVADRLGLVAETEGAVNVEASNLRAACEAVRNTYRCRDVRKELRRVMLLCDAVGDEGSVTTENWPTRLQLPAAA